MINFSEHPIDPVELDFFDDAGADIDLCVQGAPILRVLGTDNFPCLGDDERPGCDAEVLEIAQHVRTAVNCHRALLDAIDALFPADGWAKLTDAAMPDLLTVELTCRKSELLALRDAIRKTTEE